MIANSMGSFGSHFLDNRRMCEVAHTSPQIIPYKIRQIWSQEGTHLAPKTNTQRRDGSCNGVEARSRAEAPKETGAPQGARAPKGGRTSAQFIASETKGRSGPRNPWTKSGGDRTGNPRGLYPLDEARTPGLW